MAPRRNAAPVPEVPTPLESAEKEGVEMMKSGERRTSGEDPDTLPVALPLALVPVVIPLIGLASTFIILRRGPLSCKNRDSGATGTAVVHHAKLVSARLSGALARNV